MAKELFLKDGMKMSAAIFDVDGCLLDSMQHWQNLSCDYLISKGKKPAENMLEDVFKLNIEECAEYFIENYDLKMPKEEIVEEIYDFVRNFYKEVKPKPGALEFIEYLSKNEIPMTVATSTDYALIAPVLADLDIYDKFAKVYSTACVGEGKNNPKIFHESIKIMQSKPEETWVFEDGLYSIKTAKKAGFKTLGIYDKASENDQKEIAETVDIYIKNWHELPFKLK